MARHRKKRRTHVGAKNGARPAPATNSSASREPKTMVIRIGAGEVGSSVSQLVKDIRSMMEPGTASRLKERRSNRLRDYVTMAGPLEVSHLLLVSRSPSGNTNLRLALTPRGPTLHFRIEKYSLCKDVQKAQKHPKGSGKEYLTPPLLVMNNFISPTPTDPSKPAAVPKHLESLTTTIFQSLFPAISPQTTPLSSIHRVLLLNRELPSSSAKRLISEEEEEAPYILNLRHYAITTKPTGLPRTIRRLHAASKVVKDPKVKSKGLPNLSKLEDVADYFIDASAGGYVSGSETEIETDAEVEVLETDVRKVLTKKQRDTLSARNSKLDPSQRDALKNSTGLEKRAVKLVELGPRMKLRMTKVEEGVCGGKVLWHEYMHKSDEELKALEEKWNTRRKDKEERKRIQKENVERKRGESSKAKGRKENGEGAAEDAIDEEDWSDEDFEDYEGDKNKEDGDEMDVDEEEGKKKPPRPLKVVSG
ncbi:MAG: hypothetical protein MMC33_000580 [Icmadophila ericetorum]|nr:hypothetical protein [Icmadophila ericetorum]